MTGVRRRLAPNALPAGAGTTSQSKAIMRIHQPLITCGALMLGAAAYANGSHADTRTEIQALITYMTNSPCRFNRNGTWHSGEEAAAHVTRKYDYVRERGLIDTTEDFISLAASRSSFSGRPYKVKCGDQPAQPTAQWLTAALRALRSQNTLTTTGPSPTTAPDQPN